MRSPTKVNKRVNNPMKNTYPLLDKITIPADLRQVDELDLPQVADELRAYLINHIAQCGGHFGSGLGTVELTVALHYVFNTPDDRIVWDVGHQAYPHKILTGRKDRITSIKQKDGLAPFPKRPESEYDTFGVGHSSTSIGAALGMALASQIKGENRHCVAVIGDGAMTAGMAYEALNHGGRSEEHTSELQSRPHLVCRLLLEKKNKEHLTALNCIFFLKHSNLFYIFVLNCFHNETFHLAQHTLYVVFIASRHQILIKSLHVAY